MHGVLPAVVILGVFFVGAPVVLFVLSRRQARPREDVWGDWMRRHRLSAAEAGDLDQGVARGREFPDPRLRAAAVDWAGSQLRAWSPGRGVRIALGVYVAVVVAVAVFQVTAGDADRVNWGGPALLVWFGLLAVRRRKRLRHTIEVNGEVDESR
jgi:hypothetical protein